MKLALAALLPGNTADHHDRARDAVFAVWLGLASSLDPGSRDGPERVDCDVGDERTYGVCSSKREAFQRDRARNRENRACECDRQPVVFMHGLWLLPSGWDRWAEAFEEAGYPALTTSELQGAAARFSACDAA